MVKSNILSLRKKFIISFTFLLFFASSTLGFLTDNNSWFIISFFISPFALILVWGFILGYLEDVEVDKYKLFYKKAFVVSFVLLFFILGFILCLIQIYFYLKFGKWSTISIIDGLLFIKISWAAEPLDWLGLWNILSKTPLSILFFALSYFLSRKST